jgi:hypothetical protein
MPTWAYDYFLLSKSLPGAYGGEASHTCIDLVIASTLRD